MSNRPGKIFFWSVVVSAIVFGPLVDKVVNPRKLEDYDV